MSKRTAGIAATSSPLASPIGDGACNDEHAWTGSGYDCAFHGRRPPVKDNRVFRGFFTACISVILAGCATYSPSIPEGYTGPTAQLDDSIKNYRSSKADFFVAEEINGARIDNSLNETVRRNQGRGMHMNAYFLSRALVANQPVEVLVMGRTHYAAPIMALTGTVYQVRGIVRFVPRAAGTYVVRGELGDSYSTVWIEDAISKELVGEKVEVKGSAKLGVFKK